MSRGTLILGKLGDGAELAALIEDRRIADWVYGPAQQPAPEALYKARVDRVVAPSAFVGLGADAQGYLRDAKGMKSGQKLLLEVASYPEPGKAVPVTSRILYRQRYAIHTPGSSGINVARALKDTEERARLQSIVEDHIRAMGAWLPGANDEDANRVRQVLECHRTGGTILRTAAAGVEATALTRDLDLGVAARIDAEQALADPSVPFGIITHAPLPREYALREWGQRIGRIVVGQGDFSTLELLEQHRLSRFADAIEEMNDGDPFDHFGIWDELERLRDARVDLPSGAWMAIEATRAMVTVDVNTGDRFDGGATVTANIEAAQELPRQLRLRGLGGQVTIDFAPLKKKHREKIEATLKAVFAKDPVATTLAGWTPLGNFELQRKRERRPLTELL